MTSTLQKLNEIFKEVLDNKEILLSYETTAAEVQDWDSLNHIHLVVEIENQFGITFTSIEIQKWKCLGDICMNIEGKLK